MSTPDPIPVNPTTFSIKDPLASIEGVTGLNVKFSRTSGGPYSLVAPVPAKDLTGLASGEITGALTDLGSNLSAGDWYAVVTAINAGGESDPTSELHFQIVPPKPSPPESFSVA